MATKIFQKDRVQEWIEEVRETKSVIKAELKLIDAMRNSYILSKTIENETYQVRETILASLLLLLKRSKSMIKKLRSFK